MTVTQIPKQVSSFRGRPVYLLGRWDDRDLFWLEEPEWQCGWYWSFGNVETFSNNCHPERARDISAHSHWNSSVTGRQELRNRKTGEIIGTVECVHHLNAHPGITESVFTDKESWEFAELMKTGYLLTEAAAVFGRGGSHLSTVPREQEIVTRKMWSGEINTVMLPQLFREIAYRLTPREE